MKAYLWIEKQSYDSLEKQCQMGHVGIQLPEAARVILRKEKPVLGLPTAKQWQRAVAVSSTWPSFSFQFTLFEQSATGWIIYKQWMFSGHIILGAGKYKNMSN